MDEHSMRAQDERPGFLGAVRALWSGLDVVIGTLLAVLLLPLVLGPLVAVYQFLQVGQYGEAACLAVLAAACYVVAGRAVQRGEFGTGTVAAVLAIGALILFVAVRFRQ